MVEIDINNNGNFCPIGSTLDLFNRKWIFCVMINIFMGLNHFNEFKEANSGISNHVLSQTLKYMEENKLIEKKVSEDSKTSYNLTEKGFNTNKILYEFVIYYLNELNYTNLDSDDKKEILSYYKNILQI
ncbi:winged helix-turn-helix transcriptional regulator [Methanobrevibacter olleyae]|uniref:HxlR family transcriptional regulator n=1 Tax=Methanobrevibacter olleyae TaxID=294671 RepID=A0A126R091_METOL|nr:helix-turn-helix domain-containing protein [Methanobrevibacter olleyae]AMK15484.1 HxlR family transcriptional regulator [Methanobrevibacter olleyae]SFL38451.1 transcriptional regulator, HxlR family [Methanobrevibacter olleyae]